MSVEPTSRASGFPIPRTPALTAPLVFQEKYRGTATFYLTKPSGGAKALPL